MPTFDTAIFHAINGLAGANPWLDAFGKFCAEGLIFLMAGAGILRAIWLFRRSDPRGARAISAIPRAAFSSLAAYLGNVLFAYLVWFRERPFVTLPDVHRLVAPPLGAQSFPSGHATVAFVIAYSSFTVDRTFGLLMLPAAALVAIGRVYVGVHYPLDIVVGAIVGCLWGAAARAVGKRLHDERRIRARFEPPITMNP